MRGLPKRPLKLLELEAIKAAGEYDLVRPGLILWGDRSPFDEESTGQIIIVDSDWFGVIELVDGEWQLTFKDERKPNEDVDLLYMVALEILGLAE